jgi:hypothetical protein
MFYQKIKSYSAIKNPMTIFLPLFLILTILTRTGTFSMFTPSWINPSIIQKHFAAGDYISIIGNIP